MDTLRFCSYPLFSTLVLEEERGQLKKELGKITSPENLFP